MFNLKSTKIGINKNSLINKISKSNLHIDKWNKIKSTSRDLYKNHYLQEEKTMLLSREFIYKTFHFDDDTMINITPLMDNYIITSAELLVELYMPLYHEYYYKPPKKNYDYNEKWISQYISTLSIEKERNKSAPHILEQNNFHIKKLHDIELDVTFRKNDTENQIINVKKFDSIHGEGKIYELLLKMLYCKYKFYGKKSIYNEYTMERLNKVCLSITDNNINKAYILLNEFVENTTHKIGDNVVNITKLMDEYNISPEELFYYMIRQGSPFNMGAFDHKDNKIIKSVAMAKEVLEKNNYFVDYYNGIAIKNKFRQNPSEEQEIRIKKFDDRNLISFYHCIIQLLNDKLSKK